MVPNIQIFPSKKLVSCLKTLKISTRYLCTIFIPWGGSNGYLSGIAILSLKTPPSNGESGGPRRDASSSSIFSSSLHQNVIPGTGLYKIKTQFSSKVNFCIPH